MKTPFLFLVIVLFFSTPVFSQGASKFEGRVSVGLLSAKATSELEVQAAAGIHKKGWFLGAGSGLDFYGLRSVPIYAIAQRNLTIRSKTPFVYAQGGYNIPWRTSQDKTYLIANAKGGAYYEAGLGYEIPAFKGSRLFFSAGYSAKQYTAGYYRYPTYDPANPSSFFSLLPNRSVTTVGINSQRLSLKLGLRF